MMERPAVSQKVIDEFTKLIDSQDAEIIRLKAELHVLKCKSWFKVYQENIELVLENKKLKEENAKLKDDKDLFSKLFIKSQLKE